MVTADVKSFGALGARSAHPVVGMQGVLVAGEYERWWLDRTGTDGRLPYERYEIEPPGWPALTPIRVVTLTLKNGCYYVTLAATDGRYTPERRNWLRRLTNGAPIMRRGGTTAMATISVFEGVVIKTTRVPAGVGLSDSIEKAEIVYQTEKPFVAKDFATASGIVLAQAISKADVTPDDPAAPIEVRLREWK